MNDRRLGRFNIDFRDIQKRQDFVRKVMDRVIVIKAEADYATMSIEYVGISPDFSVVEPGCIPPKYQIVVEDDEVKFVMDTLENRVFQVNTEIRKALKKTKKDLEETIDFLLNEHLKLKELEGLIEEQT